MYMTIICKGHKFLKFWYESNFLFGALFLQINWSFNAFAHALSVLFFHPWHVQSLYIVQCQEQTTENHMHKRV